MWRSVNSQESVLPFPEPLNEDQYGTLSLLVEPVEKFFEDKGETTGPFQITMLRYNGGNRYPSIRLQGFFQNQISYSVFRIPILLLNSRDLPVPETSVVCSWNKTKIPDNLSPPIYTATDQFDTCTTTPPPPPPCIPLVLDHLPCLRRWEFYIPQCTWGDSILPQHHRVVVGNLVRCLDFWFCNTLRIKVARVCLQIVKQLPRPSVIIGEPIFDAADITFLFLTFEKKYARNDFI